jgi:hypothetical protein
MTYPVNDGLRTAIGIVVEHAPHGDDRQLQITLLRKATIWIAVALSVGTLKVAADESLTLQARLVFDGSARGRTKLGA